MCKAIFDLMLCKTCENVDLYMTNSNYCQEGYGKHAVCESISLESKRPIVSRAQLSQQECRACKIARQGSPGAAPGTVPKLYAQPVEPLIEYCLLHRGGHLKGEGASAPPPSASMSQGEPPRGSSTVKLLRVIAFLLNAQTPLLPLNILLSLLLLVALLAGILLVLVALLVLAALLAGILLVLVALLVGMLLVLVALLPALLAKGILIVPDTPLTPLRVPLAMAALGNLDTVLAIVTEYQSRSTDRYSSDDERGYRSSRRRNTGRR
ncbi:hypothetical protein LMH87_000365 [Akanthomyces muscarius]|uniref:Uncharacterized protein n=1 Tax=Akanthomyces muscarius TaxID=2231603 RepID=A0A9W8QH53_AKAMU|nr:hypothetical protein LMH87_000365 [Akanthomyces muscarius]KAJ4155100.1 hypothetical protein LMH87_000365 [Akanthomyces muscarius]